MRSIFAICAMLLPLSGPLASPACAAPKAVEVNSADKPAPADGTAKRRTSAVRPANPQTSAPARQPTTGRPDGSAAPGARWVPPQWDIKGLVVWVYRPGHFQHD